MTSKPRKPIRRVSSKRAIQRREYWKARKFFLTLHPWCEWGLKQFPMQLIRSTQIHHLRGRSGTLYLNEKFWLAVSAQGHEWINRHPAKARELGLLCPLGHWGRQA